MATIALALGTLAMAGVIGSDVYARAAGAEARGVQALSTAVAQAICPERAAAMLAAAPEAAR